MMSPRNWSYPIFTHTHIHIEDRYYIYNVGILLQNSVQHNAMQCHALYLMNIYTQYPTCFSWSSFGQQHVPCVFSRFYIVAPWLLYHSLQALDKGRSSNITMAMNSTRARMNCDEVYLTAISG